MESRHETRHPIEIQGRYRTGNGIARDVAITDLSTHGCRIFDRFSKLVGSSFLTIRIGSIGPLEAHVRWVEKGVIGLEFVRPLHPSVLEHMRTTLDGWSRN